MLVCVTGLLHGLALQHLTGSATGSSDSVAQTHSTAHAQAKYPLSCYLPPRPASHLSTYSWANRELCLLQAAWYRLQAYRMSAAKAASGLGSAE